jgi:hypothetical protein
MKAKHLIIVSMLLAIMAIGAVSASEDITADDAVSDDTLAVDDEGVDLEETLDEEIISAEGDVDIEKASNEEVISADDSEDAVKISEDNFTCEIYDEVVGKDDLVLDVSADGLYEGNLLVYVNGSNEYNESLSWYYESITAEDLNITEAGSYNVLVKFLSQDNQEITLGEKTITYSIGSIYLNNYIPAMESDLCVIDLKGTPIVGTVVVTVNGTEYYNKTFPSTNDDSQLMIFYKELNYYLNGEVYDVNVTFYDKDGKVALTERGSVEFDIGHISLYSWITGSGEEICYLSLHGDTIVGTVVVTFNGTSYYNKTFSDVDDEDNLEICYSDLKSALEDGTYDVNVTYYDKDGKVVLTENGTVRIDLNDYEGEPDWAFVEGTTVTSIQDGVAYLNLNNYPLDGTVVVTFNGKQYYNKKFSASEDVYWLEIYFKDLTPNDLANGKYKVKITYYDKEGNVNLSDESDLEIKIPGRNPVASAQQNNPPAQTSAPAKQTVKLTLKTVTVKKSAKKLVLQATLKINGKSVKGKVVKFKFNGKTYKAKTNKKGVAKVTIKKAVLKKLKVGKKVTYQASSSGKTIKKTVKVKK